MGSPRMHTARHAAAAPWISPGEPIISLRGVTKSFDSHTVLEDITFDVPRAGSPIEQFLAGRPEGPIGMDEMADAGGDTSRYIEGDTAALAFGPLARPGEVCHGRPDAERPARPAGLIIGRRENTAGSGRGGSARNRRCSISSTRRSSVAQRRRRTPSRPGAGSPRRGPCWRSAAGPRSTPSCPWPSATGCGPRRRGRRCRR